MKAKTFFFLLSLAIMSACDENNTENELIINSPVYDESQSDLKEIINTVYFVDEKNGFAAGNGKILKTVNGGATWGKDSLINLPLRSIYFVNTNIGFVVGGESSCGGTGCAVPGSIVYKTIDAGENWKKLNIPYKWSELHSVFFINENIGFAIGLGLHIKTTDGGETWKQFDFEYPGLMDKVSFINTEIGFSAGQLGNIFKTTNQGENWKEVNNESDGHIYDFYFVNENVGFAGGQKEMIKTIDGGETWQIIEGSPTEIYFIQFSDESNGIAIGKGHYTGDDWGISTSAIFRTNNGGKTWVKEDNIEFGAIASFYDKKNGYSITRNKTFKISYK